MAGAEERVLKRRIASVTNTKKITRAMELIATTRVAKAQARAHESRPYAEQITGVIENLAAAGTSVDHPLLQQKSQEEINAVALVVLTSDRGLCGAYNANVIKAAERELDEIRNDGHEYRLILVGTKASDYFRFRGYDIAAHFEGISDRPTYENCRSVARAVGEMFEGDVDQVRLIYTQFVSADLQQLGITVDSYFVVGKGDKAFKVQLGRTYSDVPRGHWVAFITAEGTLTVARNFENASRTLTCKPGDRIFIAKQQSQPR